MARRRLTDEEKQDIANKEWKKTPIFTSNEKVAYKARNLTGPKTPEGKIRSLQNLRVGKNKGESGNMSHGGYIMRLLDEEEQGIYEEAKEKFLKDYEINSSADEMILELVLIDQVRLYRVMRSQFENPSMDVDRPLNEITNRLNKNLDALGALRKQRLSQDDKVSAISIATIAQQFHKAFSAGNLQAQLQAQAEEEAQFLNNKKEREARTMDAEYEIVDDENGQENPSDK